MPRPAKRSSSTCPTIRSGVLLLVSQRTSEELLQREGKEKLATDILREAARPFGGLDDEEEAEAPTQRATKRSKSRNRVRAGRSAGAAGAVLQFHRPVSARRRTDHE